MRMINEMRLTMVAALALTPLMAMDKGNEKRLNAAAAVFSEIMATPDKGIPQGLLERAHCVVIVPGDKTLAFGFGAAYGKGYAFCRNKGGNGWSAPATVRMEGGSFGFQIGAKDTDVIMVVLTKRGEDKLLSDKFTLGAEASVAAGPVGRDSTAQTDVEMHADILSWSRTRGVFGGLSLNGATLRPDMDDNEAMYGSKLHNREILDGGIAAPEAAAKIIGLLDHYSVRKHEGPKHAE
jgi:lipid-binding SYLF domain-containing protein